MTTSLPTLTFSRAALREIDRRAADSFGIPILVLMENAGRAVADAVQHARPRHVLIICGPGNNGGDGLVTARHLANAGIPIEILLTQSADHFRGEPALQLQIIEKMKLPLRTITDAATEVRDWLTEADPSDIIVDAIFGTGLSRPITGALASTIDSINRARHRIVSIDIPSGIDCDTGNVLGIAVRATETVSFSGSKRGFRNAADYAGKLTIAPIGIPRQLLDELATPR
jgi:NAD(P)H-hydrate epimerase